MPASEPNDGTDKEVSGTELAKQFARSLYDTGLTYVDPEMVAVNTDVDEAAAKRAFDELEADGCVERERLEIDGEMAYRLTG